MEFVKVFDLAETGYRTWKFAAFGLIFVGVGAVFFLAPPIFRRLNISFIGFQKRSYRLFNWAFFCFALIWTATSFYSTFSQYLRFRDLLLGSSCDSVEGKVENFDPMPASGHKHESFTVGGVKFAYSDYEVTNAFNNTKSHGGPITADSYVRICYVPGISNNYILRLEMQGYKGPMRDYSSGFSFFQSTRDYNKGQISPSSAKLAFGTFPWYGILFMYIIIIDGIGIVSFSISYFKTSIPLSHFEMSIPIPNHLQKDIKQKLKNTIIRWESDEEVIWMRPRGLNLLYIPFMIAKYHIDKKRIIKQEVRISSGFLLTIVAFCIPLSSLIASIPKKSNIPFDVGSVFIGFFCIASVVNVWILFRRMKDLCRRTVSSSFE